MIGTPLQQLITYLARLPGLGPRSGRRCALYLMKHQEQLMIPLTEALSQAAAALQTCTVCYNLDTSQPCNICADPQRDPRILCVVEDIDDLWALERSQIFHGRYFVLGGVLSALEGVGPEELHIPQLAAHIQAQGVTEVILGLSATVDGQTTAHMITAALRALKVQVTALAHGIPVGGELDYLDDGTLAAAFRTRRDFR